MFFELEITTTVGIDTDTIKYIMAEDSLTLEEAIDDYVRGLDDCDYYLIGDVEKQKIKEQMEREV